jgi:hypothetical protein
MTDLVEPRTGIDLEKVEPPDVQVLLISYHFVVCNYKTCIIIQMWRVTANMCLLDKQSRTVGMGWSFGLNI